MYPDEQVVQFVSQHFIPVRIHVRQQADEWKRIGGRYSVQWTPTILTVDSSGEERDRVEGYLPADGLLAQLELGGAQAAFGSGRFDEAETRFRDLVQHHPNTDAAPEAFYWEGVSRYKATNNPSALEETAKGSGNGFRTARGPRSRSCGG